MECEDQILKKMEEERRCPVCGLLEDQEFDILSHLQYDVTCKEDVRTAIAKAGGFCDFHFRRFRKLANSQTNAVLLLALIREYCERDGGITIRCRVCNELAVSEARLLEAVDTLLRRSDFRVIYEQMPGLCVNHMKEVQRTLTSAVGRSWLQSCQITQMKRAIPDLQNMVERSYFDTTHDQRIVIPGSIEKFVGRKSLGF